MNVRLLIGLTNLAICSVMLAGCGDTGPALGQVSGVVNLDGKPLDRAEVHFQPSKGRASIGVTDEDGSYLLQYTPDRDGAELGTHKVVIYSKVEPSGGEGSVPLVKGRAELLPDKYHMNSTLTADVKAGKNTYNFDLESK